MSAPDFLSAGSLGQWRLPQDGLEHEDLARRVLRWVRLLPAGSVLALQGDWGRGKTDLLARITRLTAADDPPPGVAGQALWLNPWQYGTPDLLSPLVLMMQERLPPDRQAELLEVAASLIQAGTSFGLKAAGNLVPGGELLALAAPEAARVVGVLQDRGGPDRDPVASMAARFRQLATALLPADERSVGARLLVCVDDLDRCLPGRQVALLQALRFLVSAGAPVTFLVALDPSLARAGVRAHYGNLAFDADRYLDKMFDLRVNLPALGEGRIKALVAGFLEQPVLLAERERSLGELLGVRRLDLTQAFPVPALRSPRVMRRVFDKLVLLAGGEELPATTTPGSVEALVLWIGLAERWPELRRAFQDGGHGVQRWRQLVFHLTENPGFTAAPAVAVSRLQQSPELAAVFAMASQRSPDGSLYAGLDRELVRAGL